jgi:hypothetical protein
MIFYRPSSETSRLMRVSIFVNIEERGGVPRDTVLACRHSASCDALCSYARGVHI